MDFWGRLEMLIGRASGRKEVAEALGITPNTFTNWKMRKSFPDADLAVRLAKHLGVTVEYLVEGTGLEMQWALNHQELVGNLRLLSDEQLGQFEAAVQKQVADRPPPDPWTTYVNYRKFSQYRDRMEPAEREALDRDFELLSRHPQVREQLRKEAERKKASEYQIGD